MEAIRIFKPPKSQFGMIHKKPDLSNIPFFVKVMEESSYRWIRSGLTTLSGPGKRSMKSKLNREFKDSKRKKKDTEPQKRPETFMNFIGIEFRKSRKIKIRFVKLRNSQHLNIQRLQLILHILEIDKSTGWNPLNSQQNLGDEPGW